MEKYFVLFFFAALIWSCDPKIDLTLSDDPELDTEVTMGIILPTAERWDKDLAVIQSLAATENITLEVSQTDNEADQNTAIQAMMDRGVDALIVTAADSESVISQEWVERANSLEIPFICYDRLILNQSGIDFYVSFDNFGIGKLQGQYIANNTEEEDTILFFSGSSSDSNSELFKNGAMEVLQPLFDADTRILFNNTTYSVDNWDPLNANTIVDGFTITDLNNVDAILSPNDGLFLSYGSGIDGGIYSALIDKEYSNSYIAGLIVTGQDAQVNAINAILASPQILDMTILKDTRKLVPFTLAAAVALKDGLSPSTTGTTNNGSEDIPTYLVQAQVVKVDTVQTLIIDSDFLTEEELGL